MNVCLMTGARPNFIKVAPLIHSIEKARLEGHDVSYSLVYAGSASDPTLESSLFDDLKIARPDVCLGVTGSRVNDITAGVMHAFDLYLDSHPTDTVVVVDDLASTMAAAIVAKKRGLRLAHLAAGTRSFDINMPKEINRLVIDGLSDLLFTAGTGTGTTAPPAKVYVVGNILIDNLRANMERFRQPDCVKPFDGGDYALLTVNRRALLTNADLLRQLLLVASAGLEHMPVFMPLRPEAAQVVEPLVEGLDNMHIIEPLPYLEFGHLIAHAKVIVTDSGSVADEATFCGVPCVTLNSYTEHIETVKQGTNTLVSEDPLLLASALLDIVEGEPRQYSLPDRWDGHTADRILQTLLA